MVLRNCNVETYRLRTGVAGVAYVFLDIDHMWKMLVIIFRLLHFGLRSSASSGEGDKRRRIVMAVQGFMGPLWRCGGY